MLKKLLFQLKIKKAIKILGGIVQSTTGSLRYKIALQFFRSATLARVRTACAANGPLPGNDKTKIY